MRTPINIILLIVLALRGLLPAGFMIEAANAADGGFEIVICTSTGQTRMHVGDDGTSPAPPQPPQHTDPGLCPFAAGGTAVLAGDGPRTLAAEAEYAAVAYALQAQLLAETPKPGATSARGPPASLI